jgi:NTP pyrophosphatase (non-canonical NTP hydrolase)
MNHLATIEKIIGLVDDANPERSITNLTRRVLKLIEELGETSEAFLGVTSANNHKNKKWDDVSEESADVLIVAIDIALTLDTAEALTQFVAHNGHRYTSGFDGVIRELCYATGHINRNPVHAFVAVCWAFSLNELLHAYNDKERTILAEVTRKLDKWRSGVSTAEEVQ